MGTKMLYVLTIMLVAANSWAMRCGTELVYDGDTMATVVAKCGEPDTKYQGGILSDEVTYAYNRDNGMTYTITFFKNRVKEIDEQRQ